MSDVEIPPEMTLEERVFRIERLLFLSLKITDGPDGNSVLSTDEGNEFTSLLIQLRKDVNS